MLPRAARARRPTTRSGCAASCRTWPAVTTPTVPSTTFRRNGFSEMRAQARDAGVQFEIAHLCNSPAAMTRPDLAFDMVRPGIAVYGQTPIPARGDMGLRPGDDTEMPCRACPFDARPATACPTATPGSPTATPRVALLPIGYADGVFRTLSGRIDVLINGRRRRNVGRICMDQFVVDLGPGPVDVAEGDDAILFGPGHARRADRAGLGRTARHHQLRGGHQPARPGHPGLPRRRCDGPEPLSDEQQRRRSQADARWLAGAAGLAAVGSARRVSRSPGR